MGSCMFLLVSVDPSFTKAALTYFLAEIDQHLVPPFVLTCSSDAPRYMLRGSALSLFIFNTHLIFLIVFMETQLVTSTLST